MHRHHKGALTGHTDGLLLSRWDAAACATRKGRGATLTFGHRSSRTALEGTEGRRAGARRWLRIRLAPSFFLFLLLMAAAGRLTEVATLFGVLVLHELAHIAAARRRGMLVSHVELTPIGGVAHIDAPLGIDPAAELAVAAAGPAFSAALAFVGWLALRYNVVEGDWWHLFIWANVTVLGFNAVPVLPLDGGRIYRAFLARRVGLRRATVHAVRLARPLAAALLFVGLAGTAVRPVSVALLPLVFSCTLPPGARRLTHPLLIRFLAAKGGAGVAACCPCKLWRFHPRRRCGASLNGWCPAGTAFSG